MPLGRHDHVPAARSSGWFHTIDAWQWNAQWMAALAALLLAITAVAFLAVRRERAASLAAALATASVVAWAAIMAS